MSPCGQHPDVPALYQCDGCQQLLCGACIEESHTLLLCRLCGERALPLEQEMAATTRDLERQRTLTVPYGLREALFYPFRGSGGYLFFGTLTSFVICWVLSFLWIGGLFYGVLWLLIVAMQFKIVRKTAAGDNEMPADWPDFTDVGSLLADYVTWLVINVLQFVPIMIYLMSRADQDPEARPYPAAWLAIAALAWVGTAVALMGFGAAANYRRMKVLSFHQHVRAYLGSIPDSIHITNYAYGLFLTTTLLKIFLAGAIPFLGNLMSDVVGIYWIFMMPHLGGLLFRRHSKLMDQIYWPDRENA
jgi:hypothetical protein